MTDDVAEEDLGEVTELQLLSLLADEFRDGGLAVDVVEARDGAPDQLILAITMPEGEPRAVINTYFMPGIEHPSALQHFVTLPYPVAATSESQVAQTICFVNSMLPVTGFEFSATERVLVFRHSHAISLHPLDPGVVAWSLSMVHAAVANFAPLLGQVASGGDAAVAVESAQQIFDDLTD